MYLRVICAALVMLCATQAKAQEVKDKIKGYVASFNAFDNEAVINAIANKDYYEWMVDNVPYLDCPDEDIEKIYYFQPSASIWGKEKLTLIGDFWVLITARLIQTQIREFDHTPKQQNTEDHTDTHW